MTTIEKAIRAYTKGIICPAEVWNQIAASTTTETVAKCLDALPEESKRLLLECFKERPHSLMYPARESEAHSQMERWCLERLR